MLSSCKAAATAWHRAPWQAEFVSTAGCNEAPILACSPFFLALQEEYQELQAEYEALKAAKLSEDVEELLREHNIQVGLSEGAVGEQLCLRVGQQEQLSGGSLEPWHSC